MLIFHVMTNARQPPQKTETWAKRKNLWGPGSGSWSFSVVTFHGQEKRQAPCFSMYTFPHQAHLIL